MPLRILKRNCKQYNVVSKLTFVISVELLDNGVMECTLDAESTGRDCLLNISQRLGLHQIEFFGLRYISRGVPPRQRWVELDRPLRKQLDTNAQDSQLSLGVMFYVNDVNLLKDEMARYHYFLQLKSDVIDGKLNCSIEQAISLAAYSLQAEFGDFDAERHTVEYLREFAILPKDLISEQKYPQINVDGLYETTISQYASLLGFPPPLAEIYYIMVAQQLDGYGQEAFPAKDDAGNDILICVSANGGLIIRRRDWTHIAAFRWMDIKSLVGHKKLFVVESSQSHRTMQYHFADAEVAKYVRKICLLQSTFYKENVQPAQDQLMNANRNLNLNSLPQHQPLAQYHDQVDGHRSSGNVQQQFFHGVTPDLLAPAIGQSGSSSFLSSTNNTTTSSFNQSGLSLNSSNGNSFNPGLVNSGCLNPSFHPQQIPGNLQQQQQQQQLMFHHSGELYNQMQIVRTNPLARSLELEERQQLEAEIEYSNGCGRAISDYAAALHQKYGTPIIPIPDASRIYYSNGELTPRQPSQQQLIEQQRSLMDEEPIYQNEIVSQMHSMELKDSSTSNGNHSSNHTNATTTNTTATMIRSTTEDNGHYSMSSSQQPMSPSAASYSSGATTSTNTHNLMQRQPPIIELDENPPLYVFKNPPPYPGLGMNKCSDSNSSLQQKNNNSISSSNTNSSSSLSNSNSVKDITSGISTGVILSKLSPSATSAVVSAQVHSEPEPAETQKEEKNKESESESKSSIENLTINGVTIMSSSSSSLNSNIIGANKEVAGTSSIITKLNISSESRIVVDEKNAYSCNKSVNKAGQLFGKPIDPSILREFQAIPKTKNAPNFSTALKRENGKRNRCPDVLPYEDNCIRLSPTRQNPTGYINASPISVLVGDRQWRSTIVSQIPLSGNGHSLWQMIWESEIKVIVALERDSTAPFYPMQKGSPMTFNDFQIVEGKGERRNNGASIAREFNLTYVPKKKQRKVWILPYEDEWRDEVPIHTEHFLCFLEEVNSIQRKVSDPSTPMCVLCGSGAGRSGIFILSDILLHAADSGHKLRCDQLLSELRTQRMSLVSAASQYAFVLQTLAKYLAQSRLI